MLTKEKQDKIDHILTDLGSIPEKKMHSITCKVIQIIKILVEHIYEKEGIKYEKEEVKTEKDESTKKEMEEYFKDLFPSLPSIKFTGGFPQFSYKTVETPLPPQHNSVLEKGILTPDQFVEKHNLISTTSLRLYCRMDLKDCAQRAGKSWLIHEKKALEGLSKIPTFRKRMAKDLSKYGHLLSL